MPGAPEGPTSVGLVYHPLKVHPLSSIIVWFNAASKQVCEAAVHHLLI